MPRNTSRAVPSVFAALGLSLMLLLASPAAVAQPAVPGGPDGPPPDKSGFNLFNPTPDHLLRDVSPDRPDGTESPITVDAGRVQLEISIVDYSRDAGGDVETLTFADTNLKLGLTHNADLQIIFQGFTEVRTRTMTGTSTAEGFSDVTLRLKMNVWGNEPSPSAPKLLGADTAFGVMPLVKIPTGTSVSNGRAEGGVILMLGWDLGETWGLGFMTEFDVVYDPTDDDYDGELVHTAVLGFDIAGPLGGYVEYIGVASTDADYVPIFSTGLTWQADRNLIFDAGARVGLSGEAEDIGLFTGMTLRY